MGKLDEKIGIKPFAKKIGLPSATVTNNVNRLINSDEIIILAMEYQG